MLDLLMSPYSHFGEAMLQEISQTTFPFTVAVFFIEFDRSLILLNLMAKLLLIQWNQGLAHYLHVV